MGVVPPAVVPAPPIGVTVRRRRQRLGRLGGYAVTVWVLLTINFLLPRAMPGDPVEAMLASAPSSTASDREEREAAARYYGLDRPLAQQYFSYLGGLARGDLGFSIRFSRPVRDMLAERLPWTLLLALASVAMATAVGVVTGIQAGWRRGGRVDALLVGIFTVVRGMPPFFLGSVAAFVFAVKLGWFPLAGGSVAFADDRGFARVADIASHLVLPAATLGVLLAAGQFLTARAGMVNELGADYLLLGRAKGMDERRLKYAYAARNALLPVVTLTAMDLTVTASAAVIFIEQIFAYPGIGRLIFDSVTFRDYPTLQGCFLALSLIVVTLNFLAEGLYGRLDPRTRT